MVGYWLSLPCQGLLVIGFGVPVDFTNILFPLTLNPSLFQALSFYNVEGPWGGEGGSSWTDGTYSSIKRIIVTHKDVINAIQVEYRLKGESRDYVISAPQHGGIDTEGNAATINMEDDEYLTKIEGYVGKYHTYTIITSLIFTTNKNKYGPFGTEYGDHFQSSEKGKIVGFYGAAHGYLDSLGIYTLEP